MMATMKRYTEKCTTKMMRIKTWFPNLLRRESISNRCVCNMLESNSISNIRNPICMRYANKKNKHLNKQLPCWYTNANLKIRQYLRLHMKIICWIFNIKTPSIFLDMHTWGMWKVCLQETIGCAKNYPTF